MNKDRAKQIANSNKLIPVQYNGESVIINHLDEQTGVARVLPIDNLNREYNVEISNLFELE